MICTQTNIPCPNCGKKLLLIRTQSGKRLYQLTCKNHCHDIYGNLESNILNNTYDLKSNLLETYKRTNQCRKNCIFYIFMFILISILIYIQNPFFLVFSILILIIMIYKNFFYLFYYKYISSFEFNEFKINENTLTNIDDTLIYLKYIRQKYTEYHVFDVLFDNLIADLIEIKEKGYNLLDYRLLLQDIFSFCNHAEIVSKDDTKSYLLNIEHELNELQIYCNYILSKKP